MRKLLIVCLMMIVSVPVRAQTLDIDRHGITENVRVLTAQEYLPESTLQTREEVGADLPGRVAVGSKGDITVMHREGGAIVLVATQENMDWQQMSRWNSWTVECDKDAMDDSVRCALIRDDLRIVLNDDGDIFVLVGSDHYPGTPVAIRVDDHEPFESEDIGFAGSSVDEILQLMVAGEHVRTRFQEWPYRGFVDREFDLIGFNEAYEVLMWIVSRIE